MSDLTIGQRIARLIPTGTSLRWRIAEWIDNRKSVETCWASLVDFALWDKEKREDDPEGEPTIGSVIRERAAYCRNDPTGVCYCGKYVGGVRREKP